MITVDLLRAAEAEIAADILNRSITELCASDHRNDPKILADWTANKTPEHIRAWIAAPGADMLLARLDGAPAGVGEVALRGEILLNYVAPESQGKGVSRALLTDMEARMAAAGVETATLASTETALSFYERQGWRRAGCACSSLGPAVDGLPCNPMEKTL